MRHAGQVVTRTMLLEKVWDYHFDPQTNVIDVHVSPAAAEARQGLRQAADPHRPQCRLHDPGGALSRAVRMSEPAARRPDAAADAAPAPRAGRSAGPPSLRSARHGCCSSAGFRFAVLFAAMFAFAAVALVAVLWWATAGALDRQTDAAIRADAIALSERWREAGNAGLAEAIEERLAVDVENESIYLLMEAGGAGGSPATSTLAEWPCRRPGALVPHPGAA